MSDLILELDDVIAYEQGALDAKTMSREVATVQPVASGNVKSAINALEQDILEFMHEDDARRQGLIDGFTRVQLILARNA